MGNKYNGVSVIIPTINRDLVLLDTISDILKQDFEYFEIIVVDQSEIINQKAIDLMNASEVDTNYYKAKFKGLPQARNFGARAAKFDILLYIDDDIRCESHFVEEHYKAYELSDAVLIAGRVFEEGDIANTNPAGVFNKWTATAQSNFYSTLEGKCTHGKGCNFSILKSAFHNAGGMDEELSIGAALYEESELALRVSKSGNYAWFAPKALLHHLAAPAGGCRVLRDWPKYTHGLGHNRGILIFRHLSPIYRPTAILRAMLLGLSYSRVEQSFKPFYALCKGLVTGRQKAKHAPLNGNLEADKLA